MSTDSDWPKTSHSGPSTDVHRRLPLSLALITGALLLLAAEITGPFVTLAALMLVPSALSAWAGLSARRPVRLRQTARASGVAFALTLAVAVLGDVAPWWFALPAAAICAGVLAPWLISCWWLRTRDLKAARTGQIWWAEVPFEQGEGSKDRPVLVVGESRRSVTVLAFTSTQRPEHLAVTEWPGKASYLKTDRRIRLHRSALRRHDRDASPQLVYALGLR